MEINYEGLPSIMLRESMKRYIEAGIPPGGFLTAVLENKLAESFAKADALNQVNMFQIVRWVSNHAPSDCWGSPEAVKEWLKVGGLKGREGL